MGRLVTIFMVLGLLLGSAAVQARLKVGQEQQVSGGRPPAWVHAPVQEDSREAKAFCGVSRNLASEGEAREDALRSAREQIVDAIGVYGEHLLLQVSHGGGSSVVDPAVVTESSLKLVSEGSVRTRARQFHVEKWKRRTEHGVEYYHRAFVLVHWANEDAAAALRRPLEDAAAAAEDAAARAALDRALERMQQLKATDW
jgi:hypothetical protein